MQGPARGRDAGVCAAEPRGGGQGAGQPRREPRARAEGAGRAAAVARQQAASSLAALPRRAQAQEARLTW